VLEGPVPEGTAPEGAVLEGVATEGTAPEGTGLWAAGSGIVALVLAVMGEGAAGAKPHSASTEAAALVTGMEGGTWAVAGS
jgi:hypothetical protein